MLRSIRPEAFWVSSYSPERVPDLWRPWVLAPAEMPGWLADLDRRGRRRTGRKSGGIPDVVAWDPERPEESALFVECKGLTEGVREGQEDWVAAAILEGAEAERFAVAIRIFA